MGEYSCVDVSTMSSDRHWFITSYSSGTVVMMILPVVLLEVDLDNDAAERKVKTASIISSAPSLSREVLLLLPPPLDRYAKASVRYSDAEDTENCDDDDEAAEQASRITAWLSNRSRLSAPHVARALPISSTRLDGSDGVADADDAPPPADEFVFPVILSTPSDKSRSIRAT